jgi:exodeoxyribonuclease V beta subunit
VLTIHRSKGLEFPIVYVPFLWDPAWIPRDPHPVVFHDPSAGDRRMLDVGLEGSDYSRHRQQSIVEERGEELRLAYVALTRARHQAVIWWAGSSDSRHSPLGRLLFCRGEDGVVAAAGSSTPSDGAVWKCLEALAAAAPGRISVELSSPGVPTSWAAPPRAAAELTAARFERRLDRWWRRTSYTDITAGAYDALVGSEPEEPTVRDEPGDGMAAPSPSVLAPADPEPLLLSAMGGGTAIGTLVHRVLEATDFASSDLEAELGEHLDAWRAGRSIELGGRDKVVRGLADALCTPLGPTLGGMALRDVRRADRLDELAFELPLVGGDEPSGSLTLAMIARVLGRHVGPGEPLAGYAERLSDPSLRSSVRGYLTGSLDLVVRVRGAEGEPRFAVLDYKTNRLAAPDEPLSAWHYRCEALEAEMLHSHYGLQALLYAVALHRYLRWRLAGYDPARNLAGVLYLFVRGMRGGSESSGVWSWMPSSALVTELSDVLDRGE